MFSKSFSEVPVNIPQINVPGWLPIPHHFNQSDAGKVYNADAMSLVPSAREWAKDHHVNLSAKDKVRTLLMVIDPQLTFCHPDFTLFVGGESGLGAVEDSVRLCRMIYGAADKITDIAVTMDTHRVIAIFHEDMIVDQEGNHISNVPPTPVMHSDVISGQWRVDPKIAYSLNASYSALEQHLIDYTRKLEEKGRYSLIIWPYHAMLGSVEHALVPAIQEAILWHHGMRNSRIRYEIKGEFPLVENYSVLGPEVETTEYNGQPIVSRPKNTQFLDYLLEYDVIGIAGQASSHCVAWTIDDLRSTIAAKNPKMAEKVHIISDCTSPVVVRDATGKIIPGPYTDFRPVADQKMKEFENAGMHIVKSTDPIETWPGYVEAAK